MCGECALSTLYHRVSRPQRRLAGVAVPSEPASRLIADVPLGMIWPVTFMSDVKIGMERTMIVVQPQRPRRGQIQAHGGCCGVVLGAAGRAACGWLAASPSLRLVGTASTGFNVCQDPIPLNRTKCGLYQRRRSVLYRWSVSHKPARRRCRTERDEISNNC